MSLAHLSALGSLLDRPSNAQPLRLPVRTCACFLAAINNRPASAPGCFDDKETYRSKLVRASIVSRRFKFERAVTETVSTSKTHTYVEAEGPWRRIVH